MLVHSTRCVHRHKWTSDVHLRRGLDSPVSYPLATWCGQLGGQLIHLHGNNRRPHHAVQGPPSGLDAPDSGQPSSIFHRSLPIGPLHLFAARPSLQLHSMDFSTMIPPRRVLSQHGDVTVAPDGVELALTLTNKESSTAEVTLDYGRVEGGTPIFQVMAQSTTTDQLAFRTTYSETLHEVEQANGDGPFLLFSNAMDTYRSVTHTVSVKAGTQAIVARYAQRSQRYQRLRLVTPNASITFLQIGFRPVRPQAAVPCSFKCSDPFLNKIWHHGVRTVDMCTAEANETEAAWYVSPDGTTVYGQHWAPCRFGTRWLDKVVRFEVRIDGNGASWGVHMVANGLVFLLDKTKLTLTAYEGLSHESSVFPSFPKGTWTLTSEMLSKEWLALETVCEGSGVSVSIEGLQVAEIHGLDIHPILGGAPNNSGSVAFGGPEGWISTYRNLTVTNLDGSSLYSNSLLPKDKARTFADFAVGTSALACTLDGAKRDRATFGGDLYISGRSIAYSTANFDAVKGSIKLLTSHQTKDGYLGNLCPIQAPQHSLEDGEPPTYAFYSLTYALHLLVAIKDYWLHTGDEGLVKDTWRALKRLVAFTEGFVNRNGLVAAPPPLSCTSPSRTACLKHSLTLL
jgi:alpha-L-rhamnosidase